MTAENRRREMMFFMLSHNRTTYEQLAQEFGVSKATVRKDIQILMCSYPITTVRGRYGGGIKLEEWYTGDSLKRAQLRQQQMDLMDKLKAFLAEEDLPIFDTIVRLILRTW